MRNIPIHENKETQCEEKYKNWLKRKKIDLLRTDCVSAALAGATFCFAGRTAGELLEYPLFIVAIKIEIEKEYQSLIQRRRKRDSKKYELKFENQSLSSSSSSSSSLLLL